MFCWIYISQPPLCMVSNYFVNVSSISFVVLIHVFLISNMLLYTHKSISLSILVLRHILSWFLVLLLNVPVMIIISSFYCSLPFHKRDTLCAEKCVSNTLLSIFLYLVHVFTWLFHMIDCFLSLYVCNVSFDGSLDVIVFFSLISCDYLFDKQSNKLAVVYLFINNARGDLVL